MADIAKIDRGGCDPKFNTGKACRRGVFACCLTSDSVIHRETKKVRATLTMAITLSILVDLKNSFPAAKSSKFSTKSILGCPPHLKYFAVLP